MLVKDGVRKFYMNIGICLCVLAPFQVVAKSARLSLATMICFLLCYLFVINSLLLSFFSFFSFFKHFLSRTTLQYIHHWIIFHTFVPNFHPLIHSLDRANPSIQPIHLVHQIRSRNQLGISVINLKLFPSRDFGVVIYIVWGRASWCLL